MKKLALTAALGAACLGLSACGGSEDTNTAANDTAATGDTAGAEATGTGTDANAAGTATASADPDWPRGTRIVEENGVTYRVNADGSRVRLESKDVRIVTDNGVRYRVRRDGTRVRIDDQGIDLDIDTPDLTPDIDVGINKKGNPDIDVKTDRDGDTSPN